MLSAFCFRAEGEIFIPQSFHANTHYLIIIHSSGKSWFRSATTQNRTPACHFSPFAIIGQLTGLMHVAFAQSNPHDEGIETLGTDAITQFAESAQVDLDIACSLMDGDEGDRLRQRRNMISEHLG